MIIAVHIKERNDCFICRGLVCKSMNLLCKSIELFNLFLSDIIQLNKCPIIRAFLSVGRNSTQYTDKSYQQTYQCFYHIQIHLLITFSNSISLMLTLFITKLKNTQALIVCLNNESFPAKISCLKCSHCF